MPKENGVPVFSKVSGSYGNQNMPGVVNNNVAKNLYEVLNGTTNEWMGNQIAKMLILSDLKKIPTIAIGNGFVIKYENNVLNINYLSLVDEPNERGTTNRKSYNYTIQSSSNETLIYINNEEQKVENLESIAPQGFIPNRFATVVKKLSSIVSISENYLEKQSKDQIDNEKPLDNYLGQTIDNVLRCKPNIWLDSVIIKLIVDSELQSKPLISNINGFIIRYEKGVLDINYSSNRDNTSKNRVGDVQSHNFSFKIGSSNLKILIDNEEKTKNDLKNFAFEGFSSNNFETLIDRLGFIVEKATYSLENNKDSRSR